LSRVGEDEEDNRNLREQVRQLNSQISQLNLKLNETQHHVDALGREKDRTER
jgi:outer membrane murein-binding lipoprotein Lpp